MKICRAPKGGATPPTFENNPHWTLGVDRKTNPPLLAQRVFSSLSLSLSIHTPFSFFPLLLLFWPDHGRKEGERGLWTKRGMGKRNAHFPAPRFFFLVCPPMTSTLCPKNSAHKMAEFPLKTFFSTFFFLSPFLLFKKGGLLFIFYSTRVHCYITWAPQRRCCNAPPRVFFWANTHTKVQLYKRRVLCGV